MEFTNLKAQAVMPEHSNDTILICIACGLLNYIDLIFTLMATL